MCFGLSLQAQTATKVSSWELLKTSDGVSVYSKLQQCIVPADAMDSDYYLIKIVNENSFPAEVVWKLDKWYNGRCYTCENSEYTSHSYTIPANSTIEGECGRNKTESLKVYVKHNNANTGTVFTKFSLSEFEVKSTL